MTEQSQKIAKLWRRDGEALGLIEMNAAIRAQSGDYQIPPALFDAALQVLEAALPESHDTAHATYMLMGLERLEFMQRPSTRVWVHGVLRDETQNHG